MRLRPPSYYKNLTERHSFISSFTFLISFIPFISHLTEGIMHVIDFIVFIVFTLGVVVFGCSFFKKGSSADEFTSAGHSIPGWVVGMSIFATYVSSKRSCSNQLS